MRLFFLSLTRYKVEWYLSLAISVKSVTRKVFFESQYHHHPIMRLFFLSLTRYSTALNSKVAEISKFRPCQSPTKYDPTRTHVSTPPGRCLPACVDVQLWREGGGGARHSSGGGKEELPAQKAWMSGTGLEQVKPEERCWQRSIARGSRGDPERQRSEWCGEKSDLGRRVLSRYVPGAWSQREGPAKSAECQGPRSRLVQERCWRRGIAARGLWPMERGVRTCGVQRRLLRRR